MLSKTHCCLDRNCVQQTALILRGRATVRSDKCPTNGLTTTEGSWPPTTKKLSQKCMLNKHFLNEHQLIKVNSYS